MLSTMCSAKHVLVRFVLTEFVFLPVSSLCALANGRLMVIRAIQALTYSRGFAKNEADVFRYVTSSMFTPEAGDRRHAPNIVSSDTTCQLISAVCQRLCILRYNGK